MIPNMKENNYNHRLLIKMVRVLTIAGKNPEFIYNKIYDLLFL